MVLNGLNLDSSSEVLHIMRKFGNPFHWIKLYNLIYDYLVPQLKLYVHILSASRLIPDFL
jgi:hypothetical protein